MRYISFIFLISILFSNDVSADQLFIKSEILRKSNECFKGFQNQVCEELIMNLENIQLAESEQNRYKCQSSILGLQTELIEVFYFKNLKKSNSAIMLPYVIKNC